MNGSINQSTNQPIKQSINQSIKYYLLIIIIIFITEYDWLSSTQSSSFVPETANNVMTTTFKIKVIFGIIGVVIVFVSVIVYMITCYKSTPNKKKCQQLEEKRVQIKLLPLSDISEHTKEPIRHKSARMARMNSIRSGGGSSGMSDEEGTSCGYMCSTNGTSSTLVSNCLDELDEIDDMVDDAEIDEDVSLEQVTVQVERCCDDVVVLSSPESDASMINGKDSIGLLVT